MYGSTRIVGSLARLAVLFTVLLCGMILPACRVQQATQVFDVLNRPSAPSARVVAVAVTEQHEQGSRVEAIVELSNRNDIPLPLREVHYTITVSGYDPFRLTEPANRTIAAEGVQTLRLVGVFPGLVSGRAWRVGGSVQYEPPRTFVENLAEESLPLPRARFSEAGTFE
jgi:hypothetical protein